MELPNQQMQLPQINQTSQVPGVLPTGPVTQNQAQFQQQAPQPVGVNLTVPRPQGLPALNEVGPTGQINTLRQGATIPGVNAPQLNQQQMQQQQQPPQQQVQQQQQPQNPFATGQQLFEQNMNQQQVAQVQQLQQQQQQMQQPAGQQVQQQPDVLLQMQNQQSQVPQADVFNQLTNQTVGLQQYMQNIKVPQGANQQQVAAKAQEFFNQGLSVDQANQSLAQINPQVENQKQKAIDRLSQSRQTLQFAWGKDYQANTEKISNYLKEQAAGNQTAYLEAMQNTLGTPAMARVVLQTIQAQEQAQAQAPQQPPQAEGVPAGQLSSQGQSPQNVVNSEQKLLEEWKFLKQSPESPISHGTLVRDPEKIKSGWQRYEAITKQLLAIQQSKGVTSPMPTTPGGYYNM